MARRWLCGYKAQRLDKVTQFPALWSPQFPTTDGHVEIGFRDLMELRFVRAFRQAGLSLQTIRRCLAAAREATRGERPFSTQKFRTDGRAIFLEVQKATPEPELLNLVSGQYEFHRVVEPSFRDIEFDRNGAPARWLPATGGGLIVLDPGRSFGQPILRKSGVPTAALAMAVLAEGGPRNAARLFEVSDKEIRAAVEFEKKLAA
jgi:uncharacterized protein (DUF433 family)